MKFTLEDSGHSIRISGDERTKVEDAVIQLVQSGAYVGAAPHRVGEKWTAKCHRIDPRGDALQIERLGHRLFMRSRSIERVCAKIAELNEAGGTQEGEIFKVGAFYTAVFYDPSGCIEP
jgi:hypothetical protein